MIHLRREEPSFSLSLEILVSLTTSPKSLATIACDLLCNVRTLVAEIAELRRKGHKVELAKGKTMNPPQDGGYFVWIEPDGWERAKAVGELYWRRVYSDAATPALAG